MPSAHWSFLAASRAQLRQGLSNTLLSIAADTEPGEVDSFQEAVKEKGSRGGVPVVFVEDVANWSEVGGIQIATEGMEPLTISNESANQKHKTLVAPSTGKG